MIIALTGHRSEDAESEHTVREKVRAALEPLGTGVVISGMANGFDLWGGDVALILGFEVWAAKPWKGHGPRASDRELYARLIENASRVVNVTEYEDYPGPWCYHARNEWMVDHADRVLAYWSGKKSGGTYACLNYAHKQGKKVRNIYDEAPTVY